ncbi:MAG: M14 family zinc carboxypeptidase [Saprospiraceae bacterium]
MRLILFASFFLFSNILSAQRYSKVKISLNENQTIEKLAHLGLEVDHGEFRAGKHLINVFSDREIQLIEENGFSAEILIEDMTADFLQRNKAQQELPVKNLGCDEINFSEYQTPANYSYGSMGGYLTYQEMLDALDQMAASYPNLFKARVPITTAYTTHEGRPIFWVKISDNPNEDEDEPEALYTALHHAREPNSLSQMIFYMWYLLENYDTNEEVKYLVDNVEMYFVPCLNPDGYIYNETTNPNGGGFWRKNRRDNGNGTFGVDLNRNYPYQWGFDDNGSSPASDSETYRGPSPGSEPEIQMVMEFCNNHQFQIALNYHTYGNLLIYPWGYVDGPSPDDNIFKGFAAAMVDENKFKAGYGSETVGYTVNGNSDDWMYGEQASKGKILSMTPEVGPQFWPTQAQIDDLNKSTMKMNLTTAHLLLNYGIVKPEGDLIINKLNGTLNFSVQKLGLKQGLIKVSLEAVSDNVFSVGPSNTFGLFNLEKSNGSIDFSLKQNINEGEPVLFNLLVDNGIQQWVIPVERIYSTSTEPAFTDQGDDLSAWSVFGDWGLTNEDFYSATTSITDSPFDSYNNNEVSEIEMIQPVVLENAKAAYLSFRAKWDIEADYDYVQLLLSIDGNAPFPLCGKYTESGVAPQPFDEPLYDGNQLDWVLEEIDLTEFLPVDGKVEFTVSFRLFTDGGVTRDGFYFDDLAITSVGNYINSTHSINPIDWKITSRPNPARDYVYLDIEGDFIDKPNFNLLVFNTLGQTILNQQMTDKGIIKLETNGWLPGVYHFYLMDSEQKTQVGKFVISR